MNRKQEAGGQNTKRKLQLAKAYIKLHELEIEVRENNISVMRNRTVEGIRLSDKIKNVKRKIKALELTIR